MHQVRAFVLAGLLTLGASSAIAADDHKPRFGGQVRESKNYDMELVAKDRELTLYLNEHGGKKFDAKAASATAIVLTGKDKATVELAPAGDNVLKGTGTFSVAADTKVLVTVTAGGKASEQVRFTPMAKAAEDHKGHKH